MDNETLEAIAKYAQEWRNMGWSRFEACEFACTAFHVEFTDAVFRDLLDRIH